MFSLSGVGMILTEKKLAKWTDSNYQYLQKYRQVSNIRRTKSQHPKDSHTVLQLSLPKPLMPYVKSRMKM